MRSSSPADRRRACSAISRRCSPRSKDCRRATTRICRTTSACSSTPSTRCCSCCRLSPARSPSARSSRERMRAALSSTMMATDLADYLVRKGATFREAHGAVGKLVRESESTGVEMQALPARVVHGGASAFADDVSEALSRRAVGHAARSGGRHRPRRGARADRGRASCAASAAYTALEQRSGVAGRTTTVGYRPDGTSTVSRRSARMTTGFRSG